MLTRLFLMIAASGLFAASVPSSGAVSPGRTNPVTYRVEYTVAVTAPAGTKLLKVWLPLPPSDAGQQIAGREFDTFPTAVVPHITREPEFGNQFAYFEFAHPRGAQLIRLRFAATVWEQHWLLDPTRVVVPAHWPEEFHRYLAADQVVALPGSLKNLLGEVVPAPHGPARDLAAVMDWLEANMTYGPVSSADRGSSAKALARKGGDCSAYHGLCAAAGRALGVPTRVAYGLHLFPKESPSHCKLEAYLPPYGWVSFDVSETQKLLRAIQRSEKLTAQQKKELLQAATARLRSGFRDNTWLAVTRGTDYDLAPSAGRRVTVVRTAYAEADGVPLPDPDPSDPKNHEFAWMTALRCQPDRVVKYPFQDWSGLRR